MDPSAAQYNAHPPQEQKKGPSAQELAELQNSFGLSRESKWIYHDLSVIEENSPSVKDGLDPAKQLRWRREYLHLIYKAGIALKVPPWGLGAAALLAHRFFSRRSMTKNDRFLIATACLHLGAKVEEGPKSIKDVVKECERIRHWNNKAILSQLNNPAYLEEAKEQVLTAERTVLYTLGFDLNVGKPHAHALATVSSLVPSPTEFKDLVQNCWNFINDSFRTTLCLQYPAEKVASATIWAANLLHRAQTGRGLEELVAKVTNNQEDLFSYLKITTKECEVIMDQILNLYADIKLPPGESLPPLSSPLNREAWKRVLQPSAPQPPAVKPEGGSGGAPAELAGGDAGAGAGLKRKAEVAAELGGASAKMLKTEPVSVQ